MLKPPSRATPSQPAEDLLLYISCTTHVVSTALVVERAEEGHAYPVQYPVYFISEVLRATPSQPAEDLLLYISCTTHVVSTALVVERAEEGHAYPVQYPVYFISEVLGPSKKKYPQVQKLLYAVLLTARKLRHYFDDHKVIVVTGFPIGDILHNKEAIGRIAKWACELGSHDIEFRPRTAIKTQALVDFVSEWTEQQMPDNSETAEVW